MGSLSASVLASKAGLDGLLIGAYSMLDGWNDTYDQFGDPYFGLDNPPFGGYASDDAYHGSNTTDQAPNASAVENHTVTPSIQYMESKWQVDYNGIQRANDAIREVPLITDGSVSADYGAEVIAEARFLRGVFHFDLAKLFRHAPYVDETVTYGAGNFNVPNHDGGTLAPIWDKIEADFIAAMTVLPNPQDQIGRANYYAAEAFWQRPICSIINMTRHYRC